MLRYILQVSLVLFMVMFLRLSDGSCQVLGNSYTWQDTVSISPVAVDSFFNVKWELVSIWTDSVDWYAVIGASARGIATTSWSTRKPNIIRAGDILVVGKDGQKLRRVKVWTVSGTGTLNFLGIKKSGH